METIMDDGSGGPLQNSHSAQVDDKKPFALAALSRTRNNIGSSGNGVQLSRIEALRRNALGFRNLTPYRLRSLLYCGNLIQQIDAR
jgi:hypothetical protein